MYRSAFALRVRPSTHTPPLVPEVGIETKRVGQRTAVHIWCRRPKYPAIQSGEGERAVRILPWLAGLGNRSIFHPYSSVGPYKIGPTVHTKTCMYVSLFLLIIAVFGSIHHGPP